MTVAIAYAGTSVLRARVPAGRRVALTVSGTRGPVVMLAAGREVGRADGLTVACDLSAVPMGSVTLTARTPSGSYAKPTTIVADPQPGPGNTGHRGAEADLTPWTGLATLAAGTYEGIRFDVAPIAGAGVVLRDCLIRPANTRSGGRAVDASGGVLLEHCTIDGSLRPFSIGIGYANWTGVALDIHHVSDGVRLSSGAALIDSWVHHLVREFSGAHADCVQTTGGTGGLVQHCTLDAWNPDTDDPCNAAVMVGGETAPLRDLVVEDCWLDGGNYTVQVRSDAEGPISLRGNRYGDHARYGPFAGPPWVTPDGDTTSDGQAVRVVRWN